MNTVRRYPVRLKARAPRRARPTPLVFACAFLALSASAVGAQEADSALAEPQPEPQIDAIELPVRYEADRFFVAPVTSRGDTLLLYTDTGGGANMLYESELASLGVEPQPLVMGGDTARVVAFPEMTAGAAIPLPGLLPPFGQKLLVTTPPENSFHEGMGLLGRTWFAGRVWSFDYSERSLGLVTAYGAEEIPAEHRVPLGFQTDSAGRRTTEFPRIRVEIDGDSLDLLFDTGATVHLTEEARARLADGGPAARGTSFITESVFRGWRERHPDWRVVDGGDELGDMPMIEVPEVSIAGHTVGPVWFTMRPDRNFHDFMSQWMDRRVDGALGGSALRFFQVLVDYPNATAAFIRPRAD